MELTIAVDVSKSVFQVAESSQAGRVSRQRRLTRSQFERYLGRQAPARILLEACGSTHYWGRRAVALGHRITMLPPHRSRRYRTGNKTDAADAKALLEAARNEEIHGVPVKTEDQQSLAALHRLRSGYQHTRVARLNAIRGLLREFGLTIPMGARKVVPYVHALEAETVPEPLRQALVEAAQEIGELEERIRRIEQLLRALSRQLPAVEYLRTIPGIGLITATALVAMVGDVRRFPSGRHFASYLGLTPKEFSTGTRRRLGSISKQGDTYLRMLLVHGARAVLRTARKRAGEDPLAAWALEVQQRRNFNVATVALANKLARIAWKVWSENRPYQIKT